MKTVKELMGLVEAKKMKGGDPCWDNYEMVGTKKKNGKEVPNCVPKTEEVVAEGSDYTPPKLGTVKANLMNTQKPTVQVQVFKHNTLRGDSYWVTKEVKTFKTMDQAQTYADRINKKDVAEDLKMLPRQGNETNAERQKRLSAELEHQYKTKTGQFANHNDNRYPSLSQYNAHGDDEYQAKKLKKQKHVKEAGDPELMGGTMSKPTASGNNPKLAGKFVKAFRKAGVDAKIKCTTINNISACEDVNVAFTEAVKKDEVTSTKDVNKGEKLSGKQEPIKINPPLPQR